MNTYKALTLGLTVTASLLLAGCGGGGGSGSGSSSPSAPSGPSQPPVAKTSLTSQCSGLNCSFTLNLVNAPGQTITAINWDFGDGVKETTAADTASHSYLGTFSGTATATAFTTSSGSTTPTSFSPAGTDVSVTAPAINPSFLFTCEFVACKFDANKSSAASGTISSYAWNFGDGQTETDTKADTTHVFATSGDHSVTLTVTTASGNGEVTQTVPTGHVGTDADIAATSLQVALEYEHYFKAVSEFMNVMVPLAVKNGPEPMEIGTDVGSPIACPGGGNIYSNGWNDNNGGNGYGPPTSTSPKFDEVIFQLAQTGVCSASGIGFTNPNGNFDREFDQQIIAPTLARNRVGYNFMNGEYTWTSNDTYIAGTSGPSINLVPSVGVYGFDAPTFSPNPYGVSLSSPSAVQSLWGFEVFDLDPNGDACDTNANILPWGLDQDCIGVSTDPNDTKSITVGSGFAWGYEFQSGVIPTGIPFLFAVSSTTPLDIETDASGNTYMKTGSLTIKGYDKMTDVPGPDTGVDGDPGTGISDLTVVLTATTDASGNPAFQVTVTDPNYNGGASFSTTIPQGQWASLPHFCTASDQSGYDCVFEGDASYYSDANNIP